MYLNLDRKEGGAQMPHPLVFGYVLFALSGLGRVAIRFLIFVRLV